MTKLQAVLLIASCFLLPLTAEGAQESGASDETAALNIFYYKDTIVEGMDSMADAFMGAHPGTVITNEMVTTEFNTVLKTKDAADRLPDLWATQPGETALKPYLDAGKLQSVEHLSIIQSLSPDFRESLRFSDGRIYVIPVLNTARGIIYNKEIFRKAGYTDFPDTLSELKEACAKIKAMGIDPFAAAVMDSWTLGSLVYQCGAEVFDTPDFAARMSRGEASHKELAQVFEFIDLFKENMQEGALQADYIGSVVHYTQGKAAMIVQGPWAADAMMEMDEAIVGNSAMAAIPYTDDPDRNKLYFDYDMYFAVSSKANAELVDGYMNFMFHGDGRTIFAEKIKAPNPYGVPYEANAIVDSINQQVQAGNIMGDVQYANAPDGWWQSQGIVMQEYFLDMIDKNEALEKLDREWAGMVQ